jgi:hypothetical protein
MVAVKRSPGFAVRVESGVSSVACNSVPAVIWLPAAGAEEVWAEPNATIISANSASLAALISMHLPPGIALWIALGFKKPEEKYGLAFQPTFCSESASLLQTTRHVIINTDLFP